MVYPTISNQLEFRIPLNTVLPAEDSKRRLLIPEFIVNDFLRV